ncbi:hypothetical protein CANMA_003996 [Candida margitis]|uniref:uncharacterized protein n=1 Tax=Candida margitis TaxID=1775924 RepID=UPI002225C9E2|nr:uncharacterized protein CANMA_003996 [Candida margitis]KAI5960484.1 hypothetical protein CANMA_003996 [Candida margitis]
MYQYTIEAPTDANTVQITGTFDNWSKSLPEITTEPFEQTIELAEKQDIVFKFIIDGNWTTLDSYPVVTDEHGNANNVVNAEHLILVEEEKEEDPKIKDSLKLDDEGSEVVQVENPVVLAVTDGEEESSNVKDKVIDDGKRGGTKVSQDSFALHEEEENIKEYEAPESAKNEASAAHTGTGIDPTSSSSSFAAVSSPPTSSDFEHINGSPSAEETTTHESKTLGSQIGSQIGPQETKSTTKPPATAISSTTNATAGKKPEKPTLLAHPSESTLRAPASSGNHTPVGESSSSSTTSNAPESSNYPPRIPGSFDSRPQLERQTSGGKKRESLISKFKSLFK